VEIGERSHRLKEIALAEGFDRAGLARLGPAATAGAYERWLERGNQAGMAYLERNVALRREPERLLPGARSILCVALQYADPEPDRERSTVVARRTGSELWPRIARYARGEDYHRFLRKRLKRMAARIEEEFPGCATRACVDTAPLLEREWAARAGIGVAGKNTNLLHPEGGSWFLLGEVLLTLDVEPDHPIADLCGDCDRCLEACPTQALSAPYELDSRSCISFWTIEQRGEIPDRMRSKLSGWVFGCDICQEVCPWNGGGEPRARAEFRPDAERRSLDLVAIVERPDAELKALLRTTPLLPPGLDGLRRNARLGLEERAQEGYERPL
jgi:epoxyqueuosine reductase